MKTIKVKFVDFSKDFNPTDNEFIDILSKRYDVQIADNPDYLFYSCFGYEFTKYDCVRIFYTGECITPDFNACDYAVGFDDMQLGDRYLRVPLYRLFQYKKDYDIAKKKHLMADEILAQDRKFCSFVVSNDAGQSARKEMFDILSSYKRVDSGGRYLNNIGYCVPDKNEFQSQYKFSMAFENCVYPGYTTEKLLQAFAAGTIPIYYGNPEIAKEFDEESFINCHNFSSFEQVLEYVKQVDRNVALYEKMLRTPIEKNSSTDELLASFLYSIVDQNLMNARRRPQNARLRDIDSWNRYIYYSKKAAFPLSRLKNLVRRIRSNSIKK